MANWLSITPDRRPEPVKTKTLRINPCSAQATCEQHRHGFNFSIKFFERYNAVDTRDRIDNAVLTFTAAAIDHIGTCLEFQDARRGQAGQALSGNLRNLTRP